MAEIQCISHSAINVIDLKEAEEFFANIFGGLITNRVNFNTDDSKRGRSVHTSVALNDWLFAVCLPKREMAMPPAEVLHGTAGYRHGFRLSRDAFGTLVERLKLHEVPFEGPVTHPEASPLGQSVYFKDPGGNFYEVCWRRDAVQDGIKLDAG